MRYYPAPKMVDCSCQWCGEGFKSREVDVKRGWGKYCSKKCKAIHQTHKANSHTRHVAYKQKKAAQEQPSTVFDEWDAIAAKEDNDNMDT